MKEQQKLVTCWKRTPLSLKLIFLVSNCLIFVSQIQIIKWENGEVKLYTVLLLTTIHWRNWLLIMNGFQENSEECHWIKLDNLQQLLNMDETNCWSISLSSGFFVVFINKITFDKFHYLPTNQVLHKFLLQSFQRYR